MTDHLHILDQGKAFADEVADEVVKEAREQIDLGVDATDVWLTAHAQWRAVDSDLLGVLVASLILKAARRR